MPVGSQPHAVVQQRRGGVAELLEVNRVNRFEALASTEHRQNAGLAEEVDLAIASNR